MAAVVEDVDLVLEFCQPLGDGFVFGMILPKEVQLAGFLEGQEKVEQGIVLGAKVGQMAVLLRVGEGEEDDGYGGGLGHAELAFFLNIVPVTGKQIDDVFFNSVDQAVFFINPA